MSDSPASPAAAPPALTRALTALGRPVVNMLRYLGGAATLLAHTARWTLRTTASRQARFGRSAFYAQIVRIGVRSIGVVALVSGCIGLILALQMAPPLQPFGQVQQVPVIVGIAVFRELGPLIVAIVLTGFAGASIAAELGTMVVGEEIEAMVAHALNPVRFLVVPRVIATTVSLVCLTIIADAVAIAAGMFISVYVHEVPAVQYWDNTLAQCEAKDMLTGLVKAGVFGMLIGLISCYNGLKVTGGAAGVGRATTATVVASVVSVIFADLIFTTVFFALEWT